MVKIYIILILLICAASYSADTKKSFEDYKVIAKKNIFSRQRLSAKSKEESNAAKKDDKKLVLEAFILRGTAINDGDTIAFVENVFDSKVYHIKAGEEFKGSVISDIFNDGITITKDDVVTDVFIGGQFNGDKKVANTVQADKPVSPQSETNDDSSKNEPSDIEKKMMERRKKQLGN